MKAILQIAALSVAAFLIAPAFAEQPAKAAPAASPTQPAASTPADVDQQAARMQALLEKMNTQMSKIQATKDPAERQKLLQEHWTTMQEGMSLMRGGMMGGGMGMGMGMGGHRMHGPMMWGDYQNLTPEQLKQRQYRMDRWMPMQQMMMDHMMQHQHWMMQGPPAAPPAK